MSTAPRYIPRYTVNDYAKWEGHWELIDGVAIAMSPSPFGPHERVVSRLSRMIGSQLESLGCPCEIYTNLDWIVSFHTVVRPDLMVVCGDQPDRHLERPPVLAAEVLSETTRTQDRHAKRELYLENTVLHYLIIDPQQRSIRHITPDGEAMICAHETIALRFSDDCTVNIACARLFD